MLEVVLVARIGSWPVKPRSGRGDLRARVVQRRIAAPKADWIEWKVGMGFGHSSLARYVYQFERLRENYFRYLYVGIYKKA